MQKDQFDDAVIEAAFKIDHDVGILDKLFIHDDPCLSYTFYIVSRGNGCNA